MAANEPTYSGNNFVLDVNGYSVTYLKSAGGMAMKAEIANNPGGPDNIVKKHVANIGWEAGNCKVGLGMGSEMYKWIKASFDKGFIAKSGSLTAADANFKAKSRLDFIDAYITEVGMPALDGAAKESCYIDVKWQPTQVKWSPGDNKDIRAKIGPIQKNWLACNFELEFGGLPCKRVSKIDAFVWKQKLVQDQIGTTKEPVWVPASVEVPELKFTISMGDYDDWAKAAYSWFIGGNHEEKHEMNGRIRFLAPNLKDELGDIELIQCGFSKFEQGGADAGTEKVANFTATVYVEQMKFNIKKYDAGQ